MLFSLKILILVKFVYNQFNIWYLNDDTLSDNLNAVLNNFKSIVNQSKSCKLKLYFNKCKMCFAKKKYFFKSIFVFKF